MNFAITVFHASFVACKSPVPWPRIICTLCARHSGNPFYDYCFIVRLSQTRKCTSARARTHTHTRMRVCASASNENSPSLTAQPRYLCEKARLCRFTHQWSFWISDRCASRDGSVDLVRINVRIFCRQLTKVETSLPRSTTTRFSNFVNVSRGR